MSNNSDSDKDIDPNQVFGEIYKQKQREKSISKNTVNALNSAPTIIFLVSIIFPPLLLPALILMIAVTIASPILEKAILNSLDREITEELEKQVHFISKKYGPEILPQTRFELNSFNNRINYNEYLKNAIIWAYKENSELQNACKESNGMDKLYQKHDDDMKDYSFEGNIYKTNKYKFADLCSLDNIKYPPRKESGKKDSTLNQNNRALLRNELKKPGNRSNHCIIL
ncbi:MAG: hypothetical protein SFT68_02470 [Rickettsiaceae bacterium]|nr:hypothetical protein [Rickettsiaceae bacterium]